MPLPASILCTVYVVDVNRVSDDDNAIKHLYQQQLAAHSLR